MSLYFMYNKIDRVLHGFSKCLLVLIKTVLLLNSMKQNFLTRFTHGFSSLIVTWFLTIVLYPQL